MKRVDKLSGDAGRTALPLHVMEIFAQLTHSFRFGPLFQQNLPRPELAQAPCARSQSPKAHPDASSHGDPFCHPSNFHIYGKWHPPLRRQIQQGSKPTEFFQGFSRLLLV
eukprot:3767195-Amphidinium_carterae.1